MQRPTNWRTATCTALGTSIRDESEHARSQQRGPRDGEALVWHFLLSDTQTAEQLGSGQVLRIVEYQSPGVVIDDKAFVGV
jgi:hypothetical protein